MLELPTYATRQENKTVGAKLSLFPDMTVCLVKATVSTNKIVHISICYLVHLQAAEARESEWQWTRVGHPKYWQ